MIYAQYTVSFTRSVPEDRWFRRVVLRRKWRDQIVFVGQPVSYMLTRQLDADASLNIEIRDALGIAALYKERP